MKSESISGYLHPDYAKSLSEFGIPRELSNSKAWILERPIPASRYTDAMGCYPLFSCPDWSRLGDDLHDLSSELVSVVVVTDPFGSYDLRYLQDCFKDVVIPFKQHFVTDLSCSPESFLSSHHRRNVRRALRSVQVEQCRDPSDCLEDWTVLYESLVERHAVTGIPAFSRESFSKQLKVPGIVVFRAVRENTAVGMLLWYVQGNVSYYHLGAYSDLGYDLRASFALFSYSVEYFAQHGVEWLNLGAGAGLGLDADSGLGRFKQGWSTGTRTAYFCGRVFDKKKYEEIVRARNLAPTEYFPAYRLGEFS